MKFLNRIETAVVCGDKEHKECYCDTLQGTVECNMEDLWYSLVATMSRSVEKEGEGKVRG